MLDMTKEGLSEPKTEQAYHMDAKRGTTDAYGPEENGLSIRACHARFGQDEDDAVEAAQE